MLATLIDQPFHKPGWVYEEKYDGYRILAYKEGANVTLFSRNNNDRTQAFSSIAKAVASLPARTLLLDGEAVAFDRKRVSRFQLLQVGKSELVYAVFDCLFANGQDLRREPLAARRVALEEAIKTTAALLISRRLSSNGLEAYKVAQRKGFEGVVAKEETSPYIEGRSTKWAKFKVHQEEEFVIAGYTAPAGSREHFGALLLGIYDRGKLHYAGKVGTGFSRQSLGRLFGQFKSLQQSKPSLVDPPREKDITHLAPRLVAQIAFQEWTADQRLRQPVFLGLRDDKRPEECVLRH
jgi:bifunctional non-homologous end joining protein LigD